MTSMTPVPPTSPRTLRAGLVAVLALCLGLGLALLVHPGRGQAASATTDKGHATLALTGAAGKALRSAGVKTTVKSGAKLKKTTVTLPVGASVVSSGAAVGFSGTITFKAGKRSVAFTGLRLTVTKKRALTVTATVAGQRVTFLTGTAATKGFALDATYSTAAFAATTVSIPSKTAKLVRTKLKLKRTPTGRVGTLVLVAPPAASTPTTPTTPNTPGGTTTTTPTATTPTTTVPAGRTPITLKPIPPVVEPESGFARPAGAVNITSASVVWHPRDSWINYINGGEGARVVGDGATSDPAHTACASSPPPGGGFPKAAGQLLTRDFRFAFSRGWFDAGSGQAVLQFNGLVRFTWLGTYVGDPNTHGIDIPFRNPEVRIGPTSEVTFRGFGERATVLDLVPGSAPLEKQCATDTGPTGAHSPSGSTSRTYERVPAAMAPGAGAMFEGDGSPLGAYPTGSEWGWVSVSFNTAG